MEDQLFKKLIQNIIENKITYIKDKLFYKEELNKNQIEILFEHLKANISITHVQFKRLLPLSAFSLKLLKNLTNTNIVELDISRSVINNDILPLLLEILSKNQIETLDISACDIGRSYIISPLLVSIANNIKLKVLDVSNNNINFTEAITALFYNIITADKLTFLNLSCNNRINYSLENFIQNIGLSNNTSLRELVLQDLNLDSITLNQILSSIRNSRIARLGLNYNKELHNEKTMQILKEFLSRPECLIVIIDIGYINADIVEEIYEVNKVVTISRVKALNSSYDNPALIIETIDDYINGKNLLRIFDMLKNFTILNTYLPYLMIQPLQIRKDGIRYLFEKEIKTNPIFKKSLSTMLKGYVDFESFFTYVIKNINDEFLFKSTISKGRDNVFSLLGTDIEKRIGYFVNGDIKSNIPDKNICWTESVSKEGRSKLRNDNKENLNISNKRPYTQIINNDYSQPVPYSYKRQKGLIVIIIK